MGNGRWSRQHKHNPIAPMPNHMAEFRKPPVRDQPNPSALPGQSAEGMAHSPQEPTPSRSVGQVIGLVFGAMLAILTSVTSNRINPAYQDSVVRWGWLVCVIYFIGYVVQLPPLRRRF